MNSYLILSSNSSGSIWSIFLPFVGLFGMYGFLFALILLPFIVQFVLQSIALFNMSKNAGFRHAWLSFIPFGQVFVEFLLPRKKFKLLFINSSDRTMMAVITLLLSYPGLLGAIAANILPVLGQIIGALIPIAAVGMNWRKKYDLIKTFYPEDDMSLILSILGTIFPLAYSIILMALMKKMPDYGFGNYYQTNIKEA